MPAYLGKLETPLQLGRERGCRSWGLAAPTLLPIPRPSLEAPSRELQVLTFGNRMGCLDSGGSLGMQSREEGTGELCLERKS